jgi:hypothetical protein
LIGRVIAGALVAGLAAVGGLGAQSPAPLARLSPDQLAKLGNGEPVQILEPVATPWPRSIVYQLIDATPEVCAAVLSDYELQATYIPRMKSARIVRRAGSDVDVEYVIDIPLFSDERSISRQRVIASGQEYRVVWNTVPDPAVQASITSGSATFAPMTNVRTSRPATLMIHDQLVVPASAFARVPLVKNKAIEASRESAVAIRRQIEREVASDTARLRRQLTVLRGRSPGAL